MSFFFGSIFSLPNRQCHVHKNELHWSLWVGFQAFEHAVVTCTTSADHLVSHQRLPGAAGYFQLTPELYL